MKAVFTVIVLAAAAICAGFVEYRGVTFFDRLRNHLFTEREVRPASDAVRAQSRPDAVREPVRPASRPLEEVSEKDRKDLDGLVAKSSGR
ncbi:MAG: hypothetical protein GMKNLPBB_03185 [Myxococcota bacterium]|nr:hypothetical protein [Myxococcota bacterium]